MYAVINLSGKFYATKKSLAIDKIDETIEYIEEFTGSGTPVTFVESLEDAADLFNVEEGEIEIV